MPECPACARPFDLNLPRRGKPQVYCSPPCRDAGNYRQRVADGRRIGDIKRSNATHNPPHCALRFGVCGQCGELFSNRGGSRVGATCHAEVCRRAVAAARQRAGGWNREAKARRRVRLASTVVERVPMRAVIARDRGRCQLCRRLVKPGARGALSASLDHVVPISLGGHHTLANVQLAHLVCNQRKNNRPAGEQLRMVG